MFINNSEESFNNISPLQCLRHSADNRLSTKWQLKSLGFDTKHSSSYALCSTSFLNEKPLKFLEIGQKGGSLKGLNQKNMVRCVRTCRTEIFSCVFSLINFVVSITNWIITLCLRFGLFRWIVSLSFFICSAVSLVLNFLFFFIFY